MSSLEHAKRHDGHKEKAEGYYTRNNRIVKICFYAVVIFIIAVLAVQRLVYWYLRRQHIRKVQLAAKYEKDDVLQDDQKHATSRWTMRLASLIRFLIYPRLLAYSWFPRHVSGLSRGQAIFLVLYWAMIMTMLWTNVIFESPSEVFGIQWEVVGFRAAWVSTVQLPLLYCTGCRINPISIITHVSHERLNWFHQWIARTLFMTLIVHWAFFYREWDIAHFIQAEIEMMPMVIWGFAAWAAIGIMVITSFVFVRAWCYKLWLATHIFMAYAVLALTYKHTGCTIKYVGASVGFLMFDVLGRLFLYCIRNIHMRPLFSNLMTSFGYYADLEILNHEYLRLRVKDVSFKWRPGQHMYLNIPAVRKFETHPFTIASLASVTESSYEMLFIIKAHAGFTQALYQSALKAESLSVQVLLQGPYGNPPSLDYYDTVAFIATGNRASFTAPLLRSLCSSPGRVSTIFFHLVVPDKQMLSWYARALLTSIASAERYKIHIEIIIHLTKQDSEAQSVSFNDIENWSDDKFSIGDDHSDCSHLLEDEYATVFGAEDTESLSLMTDLKFANKSETQQDLCLAATTQEWSEGSPLNFQPSSQDKGNETITMRNSQTHGHASSRMPSSIGSRHLDIGNTTEKLHQTPSHDIARMEIDNPIQYLDQTLHQPLIDRPSKPENNTAGMSVVHGRPLASEMIMPAINCTQDHGRVMVVAASTSELFADVASFVAKVSYEIARGVQSTGHIGTLDNIELWTERNGD